MKKSLQEHGDKIEADEKTKIEEALKTAEEALKSDNKDTIESSAEALSQASHKLSEKIYAQQSSPQNQAQTAAESPHSAADDNVVDAEFEEVKNGAKDAR